MFDSRWGSPERLFLFLGGRRLRSLLSTFHDDDLNDLNDDDDDDTHVFNMPSDSVIHSLAGAAGGIVAMTAT